MQLFLATYNILFGYDKRVFDSLQEIRKEGNNYPHAIIALQEVRKRTVSDTLPEKIKRRFPTFVSSMLLYHKPSLNHLGLMTLCSLSQKTETPLLFPKRSKRPFPKTRYGALCTQYLFGKKVLRVTNVHLDFMGGLRRKRGQLRFICDFLQTSPADYDIICGDFNTIGLVKFMRRRIERQRQLILTLLGPSFKEVPVDSSWTCDVTNILSPLMPASKFVHKGMRLAHIRFRQKLDWVFVRGFKKATATVRHDLVGSDHYPILATLTT